MLLHMVLSPPVQAIFSQVSRSADEPPSGVKRLTFFFKGMVVDEAWCSMDTSAPRTSDIAFEIACSTSAAASFCKKYSLKLDWDSGMVWSCLILISFSTRRFQAAFICSASHDCEYLAPCSAGHFELSSVGTSSSESSEWHPLLAKIQISKSYPKQIFSKFNILPIYTDFDHRFWRQSSNIRAFRKKSNLSAIQKLRTWPGAQMLLVEGLLGLAALVLSFPEAVGDLSLLTNVRAFYEQDYLCESVSCILMLSEQVMILKIRFKIATFQIKIPPNGLINDCQYIKISQGFLKKEIPKAYNPHLFADRNLFKKNRCLRVQGPDDVLLTSACLW